jgi:hypothetical protein
MSIARTTGGRVMDDPWKLHFPVELVDTIGLSKNEIAFLKKRGCPFHGKKTCVAWVRDFLAKAAGAPSPLEQPK